MEGLKKVDNKFKIELPLIKFRKRASPQFRIAKLYLLVVADVGAERHAGHPGAGTLQGVLAAREVELQLLVLLLRVRVVALDLGVPEQFVLVLVGEGVSVLCQTRGDASLGSNISRQKYACN